MNYYEITIIVKMDVSAEDQQDAMGIATDMAASLAHVVESEYVTDGCSANDLNIQVWEPVEWEEV